MRILATSQCNSMDLTSDIFTEEKLKKNLVPPPLHRPPLSPHKVPSVPHASLDTPLPTLDMPAADVPVKRKSYRKIPRKFRTGRISSLVITKTTRKTTQTTETVKETDNPWFITMSVFE